jgi:membrane protein DedA with SNARE-associated domain
LTDNLVDVIFDILSKGLEPVSGIMQEPFYQLFEQYGIYAVFLLCTVEGDITLLLAGVLAHNGYFGHFSFFKVYIFGTLGGMAGDTFGYMVGRVFQQTVKDHSFYKMAQPRIERLIDKFGAFSIIVSKYIYGIRVAMCLFNGIGRMPFYKFLFLDFISCSIWVLVLSSVGFFFSGAITTMIGDFKQIGIALFFIVLGGVIIFYLIERFLLSEKIEEASPATILKLEEKLHGIEEKLHLTGSAGFEDEVSKTDDDSPAPPKKVTAAKK